MQALIPQGGKYLYKIQSEGNPYFAIALLLIGFILAPILLFTSPEFTRGGFERLQWLYWYLALWLAREINYPAARLRGISIAK